MIQKSAVKRRADDLLRPPINYDRDQKTAAIKWQIAVDCMTVFIMQLLNFITGGRLRLKCAGTRAETRFRPSAQQTGPFKSAGASVQSTTGSRVVRISGNNAGYTKFRGSVKGTGYYFIREFPLHFPSRALPCAITFQLACT